MVRPNTPAPDIAAMFSVAIEHHRAGRLSAAEPLYRQILDHDSHQPDALHLLGVIANQRNQSDIAVDFITRAISLNVAAPSFHSNLAAAFYKLGRHNAAAASSRRAFALTPDYPEARVNHGNALIELGQLPDAVASYRLAVILSPDYAEAFSNLGNALTQIGQAAAARACCLRAVRLNPSLAKGYSNLGNALNNLGRFDQALAAYRVALLLAPDFAEAHCNCGAAWSGLGEVDHYLTESRRAIRLKAEFAEAHLNLANGLLLSGQYEEGWPEFEWRWQTPDIARFFRDFRQPQWRGEDLQGKTILLHAEQGFGDTIHFCRYVPLVASRGGRVLLEVHPAQRALLSQIGGVSQLLGKGETLPDFDLHCPLASLPLAFGTRAETIPAPIPYLHADAALAESWRQRIGPDGFKIGIAWQGNPGYAGDRSRSAPLACFHPLAALPGIRLISLQKSYGLDQLDDLPAGMTVETLGADFDSGPDAFLDSAAVIQHLDLIVTVDTAIGHLAGALGRPVWLALAVNPHWPWLLRRDDTLWYPYTRLFRQERSGDWQGLFDRMAAALRP